MSSNKTQTQSTPGQIQPPPTTPQSQPSAYDDIIETTVMPYMQHSVWQSFIRQIITDKPCLDSQLRSTLQYITDRRNADSAPDVYPPPNHVFAALNAIPSPCHVRVVILGQDPYHQPGQAMGLSFSVPRGVSVPPSLRNIFKEQCEDPALPDITTAPKHGDLTHWAQQGVLLLNAALTVEKSKPKSHTAKWTMFTDALIEGLAASQRNIVFMLWGGDAKKKKKLIHKYVSTQGHLILEAAHPSPLSANKGGWFGTRHFSKANDYLVNNGFKRIDWSLPVSS